MGICGGTNGGAEGGGLSSRPKPKPDEPKEPPDIEALHRAPSETSDGRAAYCSSPTSECKGSGGSAARICKQSLCDGHAPANIHDPARHHAGWTRRPKDDTYDSKRAALWALPVDVDSSREREPS